MFSVVIPLFNKQPWIRRALDSVAAQEFPCAEIIVVNDGSTDGGDDVAQAWGDPRLRIIDQPNQGVSAARNAGIAAATQPFVAFLDADDEWTPAFLDRMRALMERYPGASLYGSGFMTLVDGRQQRQHGAAGVSAAGGSVDFFREISRDDVVCASSVVVPRRAALAVGGFPPGVPCFEDSIFLIRLAFTGPIVLTPDPLARYDVGVQGQALTLWRDRYARTLDPTDLDRFLAAELLRQSTVEPASPAMPSFAHYARRQLSNAVLKRAYWGRFDALDRMWRELQLDELRLGWPAAVAAWAARHPMVQPCLRGGLAAIRPIRQALLLGFRRPPA